MLSYAPKVLKLVQTWAKTKWVAHDDIGIEEKKTREEFKKIKKKSTTSLHPRYLQPVVNPLSFCVGFPFLRLNPLFQL